MAEMVVEWHWRVGGSASTKVRAADDAAASRRPTGDEHFAGAAWMGSGGSERQSGPGGFVAVREALAEAVVG